MKTIFKVKETPDAKAFLEYAKNFFSDMDNKAYKIKKQNHEKDIRSTQD